MSTRPIGVGIHIGLPRTGTTTLQTHLFARHSQIHYLGIYKRAVARWVRPYGFQCRDRLTSQFMKGLMFDRVGTRPPERSAELWRQIAKREPDKLIVWSWEGLATDVPALRDKRAMRLAEVMGPAKVLVTIRHPVTLVESTYFQILRRNNRRGRLGRAWFQPIGLWFAEQLEGEIEPLLDYERTIDIYCRHFGEDAVHVLLFEDLCRDPQAFVTSICRILEIDEREAVRHTAGRRENPTSPELIETIRTLGRGVLSRFQARLAVARQLRGRLRLGPGAEIPRIDPVGRTAIAGRTRDGNRRLAERFSLDLERWSYPL